MKRIIGIAFIAMGFLSFGQKTSKDFNVKLGEPYQVVDGTHKEYFSSGDGGVISVKTRGLVVTVQKFDNNGKEIERNQYEDFPKYSKVQRILETSEGLYYFFEAYNKKEKTFSFYSRKVNKDDGTLESSKEIFRTSRPITKIGKNAYGESPMGIGGLGKGSSLTMNYGEKFAIFQSFDKSKLMIQYRLKPAVKKDKLNKDELGFYVLNADMAKEWGKEVTMPHTEKEMNNLAYTVGSDGNVYMLSFLNESKKFELISIDSDGNLSNKVLKDIDSDILIQKLELIEDEAGDIVCAGYYARGIDVKYTFGGLSASFNVDGIYSFKLTKDGEVSNQWKAEFPIELIRKYLNEKQQARLKKREEEGKAGVEDLRMHKFFAQEDGSFIIIGEQKYVRNEFYMTGTTNVAHFSNIYATKVSKEGEIEWMQKLPKNQAAVLGDNYNPFFTGQLSLRYIKGNDAHYILFVDNPKNESLSENEVPAAHKNGMGGFLSAYKLNDKDGSFERHTILDLKNMEGKQAHQFSVTRICQSSEKEFMLEVYLKGKKDGMVKMEMID